MTTRPHQLAALTAIGTLVLAGCSTGSTDDGAARATDGAIATDFGVTDSQITLGVQTDMSGVYKEGGLAITHGNELWVDDVNADGGICGRTIALDIQDNGGRPDNAIASYESQKGQVAGMLQLLGPAIVALKPKVDMDKVLTVPASWAATVLDSPAIMMVGTTYDYEAINLLSYAASHGQIQDGDVIGHILIDNDYGSTAALGVAHFAAKHDLTVVSSKIAASDTDMTATITKMKSDGVKAIFLSTAPGATASVALQNAAQGLNVPLLGNSPTFATALLANESVAAALVHYTAGAPQNSLSSDNPKAAEILKSYQAKYSDPPNDAVINGYAFGLAWQAVLEQACADGDLTRDGLIEAHQKVTDLDTGGLTPVLNFAHLGSPSTTGSFIATADSSAVSGVKVLESEYVAPETEDYKGPHEK